MSEFDRRLLDTVIEYYVYNYWYIGDYVWGYMPCVIPAFFYRKHQSVTDIFSRDDVSILPKNLNTKHQQEVEKIIIDIKNKTFDFFEYVTSREPRYAFLFDDEHQTIRNPELLSPEYLQDIENILEEDPNNFYCLQAVSVFYFHYTSHNLKGIFEKILDIDLDNPYILSRFWRYLWSSLYKRSRQDVLLQFAEITVLRAYKNFDTYVPSYIYGWIGNIYIELGQYDRAISFFDIYIGKNKSVWFAVAEPYIWKAKALSLKGQYKESLDISIWVLQNTEINDKKDFRFYFALAKNYYFLWNMSEFFIYLEQTIASFLQESDFSLHYRDFDFHIDTESISFAWDDYFKNVYTALWEVLDFDTKTHQQKVMYLLWWLYKESILWNVVDFHNVRGIEKFCFYYLDKHYEWK